MKQQELITANRLKPRVIDPGGEVGRRYSSVQFEVGALIKPTEE